MSESTFAVSGCKGTKKKRNYTVILLEIFSPICLFFRNLGDNQYENAIC